MLSGGRLNGCDMTMKRGVLIILLSLMLLLAIPAVVAGQTVTINGQTGGDIYVASGGGVTIAINGLDNNQQFKLEISSVAPDHLTPSGQELYRLNNFNMPFTLENGVFNAEGTNLNFMKYEAKKGDTIVGIQKNAVAGVVTITETRDWSKGLYDYIIVEGEVADPTQKVTATFSVEGQTKDAVGDHTLTFALHGARAGKVNVKVTIDGTEKANPDIIIYPTPAPDNGAPAPAPVVVPPEPPVTAIQTTPLAADAQGRLANTYQVRTPSETAQLQLPAGTVARDAAGNQLSSVSINDLPADAVPSAAEGAVFSFAGSAVVCSPAGATFSPAISLSFQLTPQQIQHIEETGDLPSVQWYDAATGTWESVPTTYDPVTGVVTATVDHFTIFAVFYLPAVVVEPTPTEVTPTPVEVTPTITPTPVPVPPEEPAPYPWTYLIIGVLIIILVAGGAYYYIQQKS